MSKRVNALHKRALRALYWVRYNDAIGDKDGAAFSLARLARAVDAMRAEGEDVDIGDYLGA